MAFASVRFIASGWLERFFAEPNYFFHYQGFEWVRPLSPTAMVALYVAMAAFALAIAIGAYTRVAAACFLVLFSYAELIDVTNYLNHYYLVALLAGILVAIPSDRVWSVDAWRARRAGRPLPTTAPAWSLYLVRFQFAAVYVFAGLAKLQADWLLHAQPLNTWLTARTHLPLVGPWLDELWVAYAASWAGFLYDLTIALWLSLRRTRPYAFAVVLVFHFFTHVLFNIGMFPFIMTAGALIFFSPSWPRTLLARLGRTARHDPPAEGAASHRPLPPLGLAALAVYVAVQILVPLRHFAYPGDVLWNEEGMRFSWKVMVREKHGSVTYFVRFEDGKEIQMSPRRYLDHRQEREMAGQPDLIAQLARHIAADFERRGRGPVQVRAEALVSLNGRPAHPMIDASVDLARAPNGLAPKSWILPAPEGPPRQLQARSR